MKNKIIEFRTRVQTRNRITIPARTNISEGEEILVKIYSVKKEGVKA